MQVEVRAYHYKNSSFDDIYNDPICRALLEQNTVVLNGLSECYIDGKRFRHTRYDLDKYRLDCDFAEHLDYDQTVIRRLDLVLI